MRRLGRSQSTLSRELQCLVPGAYDTTRAARSERDRCGAHPRLLSPRTVLYKHVRD